LQTKTAAQNKVLTKAPHTKGSKANIVWLFAKILKISQYLPPFYRLCFHYITATFVFQETIGLRDTKDYIKH
jgi:hypothetical protein